MSTRARRLGSAIAAAAPLVALAVLIFAAEARRDSMSDAIETSAVATALFGLGPLAIFAAIHWQFAVWSAVLLVIWGGYGVIIARTRLGLASWWKHGLLSVTWCALGVVLGCMGGLYVT